MQRERTFNRRLLFLFLVGVALISTPSFAQKECGWIWLTAGDCGPAPGSHQFEAGDLIYISGQDYPAGYWSWVIYGDVGSSDPGVVASGSVLVDASGTFCFPAYTVNLDDCGHYIADVGGALNYFDLQACGQFDILAIDITASWGEAITWSIDKSVTPSEINMFKGDIADVSYTITLDKSVATLAAVISGSVTLQTTVPDPQGFSLTIKLSKDGNPVDQTIISTFDPGGMYPFSFTLASPVAGGYLVEAIVAATNGTGDSDSKAVDLEKTISGYSSVHVTDGSRSWTFGDDGTASYGAEFSCDGDNGIKSNTATITETGQSASAEVSVNCFDLQVSKTATTTFTRRYLWQLKKTGDKTEDWVTLPMPFDPVAPPLMTLVNYEVKVETAGYVDQYWKVAGGITIQNPAPIPAVIQSVEDLISGLGATAVTFAVSFPYTLASGGTLTGTYSADLPDASNRTNTATATLVNHHFNLAGQPSLCGTTGFKGTAAISFDAPTAMIDECAEVADNMYGPLGTVCVADVPKTFTYHYHYGPWTAQDCRASYERVNIATLITNDTKTTLTSQWQVVINISCEEQQRKPLGLKADCIDPYVYKPTIRVHFIVTNPNPEPVEIVHGLGNALDPASYQGMQPTLFAPGETEWEIEIGRYELLNWLLDGSLATASLKTQICTYASVDDVYIAGIGVFFDSNKNGRYDVGEALLAPDFEGKMGELYVVNSEGQTIDSRVLYGELFFRAGRNVNFNFRQIWGEIYLVPQLSVPLPAGYRIYPNYRLVRTSEFPEPFYSLDNDFGLVPADYVPDPLANLDQPWVAALDWYLANPVRPGVARQAAQEVTVAAVPASFTLKQNYPNPFNPQTTIGYDLPGRSDVTLTVYNASGTAVARLVNESQEAGSYSLVWDAAQHPSGIYLYELRAGVFRQVKQMLLLK